MAFLIQLLSAICGELFKQFPTFLREMFAHTETTEVKDGPLNHESAGDVLSDADIDRMLGK